MKQKLTLLFIILFCFLSAKADDFTPYQQQQIRNTVKQYTNSLAAFASDGNNIAANKTIINLFTNKNNLVFNDLADKYNELTVYQYLNKIMLDYNNKLQIKYLTPIDNVPITGYKFGSNLYAQVILDKTIAGGGINKTVKNYIYVDVNAGYKLMNIGDKIPVNANNLTPLQMWQKGLEDFNNAKYSDAVNWFKKGADAGHIESQRFLAILYYNGVGTKQNENIAFNYFYKAAKQGDIISQNFVGYKYYEKSKYDSCFYWTSEASKQNNSIAFANLGFLYINGFGCEQNFKKAFNCLKRAEKDKIPAAMLNLSYLYGNGYGVEKNETLKHEYYSKAYKNPTEFVITLNTKPDEKGFENYINPDIQISTEVYKKLAEQGNANAMRILGELYFLGNGCKQDLQKALSYYMQSALLGNVVAQNQIGLMYMNGWGITKNNERAKYWLQKAANSGSKTAKTNLKLLHNEK